MQHIRPNGVALISCAGEGAIAHSDGEKMAFPIGNVTALFERF